MKNFVRNTAIAAVFLLAGQAMAQSAEPVYPVPVPDDHPVWNDPLMNPILIQLSAEFMVQELHLDENQAEKLRMIEEEINHELIKVDDLPEADRGPRQQALLQERTDRVEAVLTPVQADHLAEIKVHMLRDRAAKLAIQREAESGE